VPEASDHLVEDEQGLVAVAEAPQPGQELVLREDRADVVRDRLDDDRGDLAAGQRLLGGGQIVEGHHDGGRDGLGHHAGGERIGAIDALRR
jgi:hypothetical protein